MAATPSSGASFAVPALTLLILSGCATANLEQDLTRANDEAASFTSGTLRLARSQDEREQRRQAAAALLTTPLGQKEAVQLALVNSPALQTLLAQNWAQAADAAQSGRITNPLFSFGRLSSGSELELGRTLSFGLLDLLTLPQRQRIANQRIEQTRLRLTSDVVDQVTQVRQAWVRAVAARQTMTYARQVYLSAEAGAELARRVEAAGNFSPVARARQQAFYADAATRLASAQQQKTATHEALIRLLGLDDGQSQQMKLPDRLPNLPPQALPPEQVAQTANQNRLDVRLAQSAWNAAAQARGLNTITRVTDIELGIRRNTVFDNASASSTTQRGYDISVRLPVFDWGDMQGNAMDARALAAANHLEATVRAAGSSLREHYGAYRTAYDIVRHYRDEVMPLRQTIARENQRRYNGMLIGVFELLADARDQVETVLAAIGAEQQFWLADAALQAAIIGRPAGIAPADPDTAPPAAAVQGH